MTEPKLAATQPTRAPTAEQRSLPGTGPRKRGEAKHGGTLITAADVVAGDLIVLAHRPRPVAAVDRHTIRSGADRVTLYATGRTFTFGARDWVERCGHRWEVPG